MEANGASKSCSSTVILRNNDTERFGRSKKCISVIVEPSTLEWKNESSLKFTRKSMYELGTDGWITNTFDGLTEMKNKLNLDKEIGDLLSICPSADVRLGCIKLTF